MSIDNEKVSQMTEVTSLADTDLFYVVYNAATTPVPRRIQAKNVRNSLSRVYDAKVYGAAGDGVTNDSPAIVAAIAAMPSTGGVLFFPAGTYSLGAIVDVDKPVWFQGVPGTVLTRSSVSYFFRAKASGVTFAGIKFQKAVGQGGQVLARDVALANKLDNTDWKFVDCEFQDCWIYAERLGATDESGDTVATGSDIAGRLTIDRCYFHDVTGTAYAIYTQGISNLLVTGCHFINIGESLVGGSSAIKLASGTTNYRIADNYIYDTYRSGIDCFDSSRGIISGNVIDTTVDGNCITIKTGVTVSGDPIEHLTIVGNHCYNANDDGISCTTDYCSIVGNRVIGCTTGIRQGLKTGTPTTRTVNSSIVGNSVFDCTYGILVRANFVAVQGNNIHNSSANGIYVLGSNDTIVGNTVDGSTSDDIVIDDDDGTCVCSNNITEDGTPIRWNRGDVVTQASPQTVADGDTALTTTYLKVRLLRMASSTAPRAPTVPTGTDVNAMLPIHHSIDWTFINTGDQTVTITAATGHTLVGAMAIPAGTSGTFRTRCSAANTAITYRL